ncbi:hypothetical protein [Luteolibacter sp. AS25]|uniref:hypothetical protein n=1 Tax=Luteolibacter sp. AS25 TaxID=3135776 RepID=UPI00398A9F74
MKSIARRVPVWAMAGITILAYFAALIIATTITQSTDFWSQLFATPRFRTGFIIYSMPFLVIGILLTLLGQWTPHGSLPVMMRRIFVGLSVSALLISCVFLVIFAQGFDWKLSI